MPQLFSHVSIIECVDSDTLDHLLAGGLERFVVRRLSPSAVAVDHERLGDLEKLLRRQGRTPKITLE
jgi:hypothetical protein